MRSECLTAGITSSKAMTAEPMTRVVRSASSFSSTDNSSSFISGSKLYSFGMAWAAVFLTEGFVFKQVDFCVEVPDEGTHVDGRLLDGEQHDGHDHLDPDGGQDAEGGGSDQLVRVLQGSLGKTVFNLKLVIDITKQDNIFEVSKPARHDLKPYYFVYLFGFDYPWDWPVG